MEKTDMTNKLEALKSNLEDTIYEGWDVLTRERAFDGKMPEGISVEVNCYYDGGTISLRAERTDIMVIEKDVEYSRLSISIPAPFNTRSDKLLGLLDRVIPDIIEEQREIDRQKRLRVAEKENAAALAVIDELPDPFSN